MLSSVLASIIRAYNRHAPMERGKYHFALWAFQHLPAPSSRVTVQVEPRLRMELDLRDFVQSQIYYLGYYEPHIVRTFLSFIQNGSVVVDIGAHVGQFTLLAAVHGAQVHAFEPNPQNFERMRYHVELNRCSNVFLNPLALSDKQQQAVAFHLPSLSNTGTGSLRTLNSNTESVQVNTTTLDHYFKQVVGGPQVVKMDVEGAELLVLQGAQVVLQTFHPVLLLEASTESLRTFGASVADLHRLLQSHEYNVFAAERGRWTPVERFAEPGYYANWLCLPAARTPTLSAQYH